MLVCGIVDMPESWQGVWPRELLCVDRFGAPYEGSGWDAIFVYFCHAVKFME